MDMGSHFGSLPKQKLHNSIDCSKSIVTDITKNRHGAKPAFAYGTASIQGAFACRNELQKNFCYPKRITSEMISSIELLISEKKANEELLLFRNKCEEGIPARM